MHGGAAARQAKGVGGARMTARRPGGRTAAFVVLLAVAAALAARPSAVAAQDTTRIILPADTMHRGVRPMGAFLRSFLLPGWGQVATDRPVTGATLVAWEGVPVLMTIKAQQEANYFK